MVFPGRAGGDFPAVPVIGDSTAVALLLESFLSCKRLVWLIWAVMVAPREIRFRVLNSILDLSRLSTRAGSTIFSRPERLPR
ncbi:MAG: hypothetical protein C3L25_10275 [Candidatus Sedimenticola endophacoides]|uniref:Uncharacterized protein n=1 Tax=Candidatus Sedimenticola endophacoides TaxID=2548426 RepID=A0A657PYZ9_9GAMM|nr:MAG: hypothetical protein B0D94_11755 [Candidatus Sedimenticola endophacoides]OQX40963.1 MAG: hypothetical protein B0D89_05845 [Candidatus Sedimenticola endophacoides]OQX45679.1 MAG: hypothetical protein B0D86_03110 [Candidatus Sedimenticola endophacoides]OQX45877.1 MAG: hypothetical protein B0D85_04865 [Candidatus Sedimenticola endophacoides]OQX48948.1 MAG: hypothetical protein B0D87_02990 [Candidatus Sedimenticola endophacoides]